MGSTDVILYFTLLLMIYKKTTDNCVSTSYYVTFQNCLLVPRGVLLIVLDFLHRWWYHVWTHILCLPSHPYAFYFLFMPYWINKDFQYHVEKEWWKWTFWMSTSFLWESFKFLIISYNVICRFFFFVESIKIRKFSSISSLLKVFIMNECCILLNGSLHL